MRLAQLISIKIPGTRIPAEPPLDTSTPAKKQESPAMYNILNDRLVRLVARMYYGLWTTEARGYPRSFTRALD